MADVFVSYKAEDRRRVRPLVEALQQDGLDVWWDAHISGGDDWRDQIQRRLDEAKYVIVVWSKRSAGPDGHFVRDEASRAQRRHTYLPVRLDNIEVPLGFGETQAIPLEGWRGNRKDPRYQSLLAKVRSFSQAQRAQATVAGASEGIRRRAFLVGGATIAAAAAVGAWVWTSRSSKGETASIAVLPFANLSGDPAQQYFADGIAEELRGALARVARLKVIGRTTSEAMRNEDARSAAKKLAVSSIVTGSVRRSRRAIRITAQLVDGNDGVELWSSTFDRAPGDVLIIQTEIAENVARSLAIQLAPAELSALAAGGTRNAAAHDLLLKAQALAGSFDREEAQRQALAYLDAAIALDPQYADAHATRSLRVQEIAGNYPATSAAMRDGYEDGAKSARRAIRLARNFAGGYAALGNALQFQLSLADAERQFERAYKFGAGDARTLRIYADFLGKMGKSREAMQLVDQAAQLDPLHPRLHATKANVLFFARRYTDAAAAARQSLTLAPTRIDARSILVGSLLLGGHEDQALAELAKLPPGSFRRIVAEGIVHARVAPRSISDRAVADLAATPVYAASVQLAQVRAQRGEKEGAMRALESAWGVRDPGLVRLPADPFLDPIRNDRRFRSLLARLAVPA